MKRIIQPKELKGKPKISTILIKGKKYAVTERCGDRHGELWLGLVSLWRMKTETKERAVVNTVCGLFINRTYDPRQQL